MMKTIWISILILVAVTANGMDPAFTPDDTPLTKDMKSRAVWVSPETDIPLSACLKDIQDKANSNYSTRITFRLFTADGQEEKLITAIRTNGIPVLGGFRCSLFDFAKWISEAAGLDYQLNDENREIIFRRKRSTQPAGGAYGSPAAGSPSAHP